MAKKPRIPDTSQRIMSLQITGELAKSIKTEEDT